VPAFLSDGSWMEFLRTTPPESRLTPRRAGCVRSPSRPRCAAVATSPTKGNRHEDQDDPSLPARTVARQRPQDRRLFGGILVPRWPAALPSGLSPRRRHGHGPADSGGAIPAISQPLIGAAQRKPSPICNRETTATAPVLDSTQLMPQNLFESPSVGEKGLKNDLFESDFDGDRREQLLGSAVAFCCL
jgi:hypothetical protein